MPITTFRNWQKDASLREKVVVYVIVLLIIATAGQFVSNYRLSDKLGHLDTTIAQIHAQIDSSRNERNAYFTDERGVECEILHKLGGYTPVCDLTAGPGDPVGAPTETTLPTTSTTTP